MIGNVAFTVMILAIVLGVLVFVHELGHYMAAKAFGVWVHRFAIGIGKPIPGLTFKRGETEWAIAWLPLGGYVKMASREHEPASAVLEGDSSDEVPPDRVFEAKPVWQRMIIILSGVTLNAIFALLIFTGLAWKNGRHYDPTTSVGRVVASALPPEAAMVASLPRGSRITAVDGHPVKAWDDITDRITQGGSNQITLSFADHADVVIPLHRDALTQRAALAGALEPVQPAVVGAVGANTPAGRAGILVGDSIVAIDDSPITAWAGAVDLIQPAADRALTLSIIRNGARLQVRVTPESERRVVGDPSSPMIGRIGIAPRTAYLTERLSLPGAIREGASAWSTSAGFIFRTIRGLFNRQVSSTQLGGPILIGQMAAQEARAGIDNLLAFIALISVNLAVVNLLPIPVLDGGALLFLIYEGLVGRALPAKVREAFSMVGLVLIVLLMVVAFKNDIFRLFNR